MNWRILLASFLEKLRKIPENPSERLTEIGLKEEMTFLDVGCALGFYSFSAASIVGEKGLVYALDKNSNLIEYVAKKVKNKEIENIKAIAADATETGLDAESVDIVFLHLVLHNLEDKELAMREFNRVLKAGGKLVIDEEDLMPVDTIRKLAEETGFKFSRSLRRTIQIFEKI